jgi:multiple sugar transport system permease protein
MSESYGGRDRIAPADASAIRIRGRLAVAKRRDELKSVLFLLPSFTFLALFMIYPIGSLLYHSLTEWGGSTSRFIGLANYRHLLVDPQFWLLLRNNAVISLSVPVIIVFSVIISVCFFEKFPGWEVFRGIYFMPAIISTVVIGFLFRTMFRYVDGPVNIVLRMLGLGLLAIDWLSVGWSARLTLMIAIVWMSFGTANLIMLAGLSQYPSSIFESSIIDGASWLKRVVFIYIPLLRPTIQFYLVTSVIWTFSGMFGLIFPLTNGGPGYETTTLDYIIYLKAFSGINELGTGSAIATILMMILLILTFLYIRVSDRDMSWSGTA